VDCHDGREAALSGPLHRDGVPFEARRSAAPRRRPQAPPMRPAASWRGPQRWARGLGGGRQWPAQMLQW